MRFYSSNWAPLILIQWSLCGHRFGVLMFLARSVISYGGPVEIPYQLKIIWCREKSFLRISVNNASPTRKTYYMFYIVVPSSKARGVKNHNGLIAHWDKPIVLLTSLEWFQQKRMSLNYLVRWFGIYGIEEIIFDWGNLATLSPNYWRR